MRVQFDIASLVDSLGRPNAQSLDFGSYGEIYDAREIRGVGQGRGRPRGLPRGRPRGRPRVRPRGHPRGRPRGRSGPRGPRKAAEPTGDIKFRLSKASQAFIDENYDEAMEIVSDVIRINAETYEAWTLLASIFKELGDVEKTLTALMCAAHLRPKDVSGWLSCAQFALEETGELRKMFLTTAKLCYQSAIRADPKNDAEARCGKAAVLHELGNNSSAISEYKRVLSQNPHDPTILRLLAELYIDQDNVGAAKDLYDQAISFYKASTGAPGQLFGWSDINIYVELYAYLGQYDAAIRELKSLSRWILGRHEETWWDKVVDDDREWDADDARRMHIEEYIATHFDSQLYGEGLPLELRVKLGLYRLRLGNFDEAMVWIPRICEHMCVLTPLQAHFNWLEPENLSDKCQAIDYPDLFWATADCLQDSGFHQQALIFYQALHQTGKQTDPSLHLRMGKCYLAQKLNTQAEEFFQLAIQLDECNIDARVQLAKMYEDLNEQEQAFIYVSEIMKIRRMRDSEKWRRVGAEGHSNNDDFYMPTKLKRKTRYTPRRLVDPSERQKQESLRAERLQEQFAVMRLEQNGMRAGQEGPTLAWMEAAQDLIEDFRGFKTFYPWDKYVHFLGYAGVAQAQAQTGATPLDADLAAMADRLSHSI
jgi:general transcription factor 3C polypeptide 3 (transcription factor C subunit 4)